MARSCSKKKTDTERSQESDEFDLAFAVGDLVMIQHEWLPELYAPSPGIILQNVLMDDTFAKVYYDNRIIYVEVFRLYIDEGSCEDL